jgi:H+-transporting ATPase
MSQDASRPPGTDALKGLTAREAARRLQEYGPNTVREERLNPLLVFFGKFWAPVPWMLEATIALQLVFGKRDEAIIIAVLLVFNSLLSFVQEAHSNKALALLRKRLSIQARVLRDDRWQLLPAQDIVPGDTVHLRMGDISPADVHLLEGEVLLDQSALTGESLPVEASRGDGETRGNDG